MTEETQPFAGYRRFSPGSPAGWPSRLLKFASVIRRPSSVIRFEQAVYGSFAFRDGGYDLLAQSPGCRPEWLADFRAACQNLGERPSGVAEAPGLFALRLPSGPWAVVGVCPQGCDDRGRPGALAFHGLFLTPREYRKAGCDPFALAGALRDDWSAGTRTLPAGAWVLVPSFEAGPAVDPRTPGVVSALARGRRVALESPGPVDGLAREVWGALPVRVRARASVATWAFGNGNRFDLLAAPRVSALALDASYVDPSASSAVAPPPTAPAGGRRRRRPLLAAVGLAALLGGAGVGLALRGGGGDDDLPGPGPGPDRAAPVAVRPSTKVSRPPSPAPGGGGGDVGPEERRRVSEAVAALAERFGVATAGLPAADPGALMERVARTLRYRGPFLSDADRAELAREPGRDAAMALRWDGQARLFADDRPLPEGFRRGPLRWQVGALAWSFHREADARDAPGAPKRTASEVTQALGESLAVDVPLRATPLSARYPPLASYLSFLGRLPRR